MKQEPKGMLQGYEAGTEGKVAGLWNTNQGNSCSAMKQEVMGNLQCNEAGNKGKATRR